MRNLAENYATPPATLTNHAIFNLNQLLIILLSSSSGEDSKFNGSSAQDVQNSAFAKIKEWLHSLIHKFDELFPPEKVHHWLTEALHWLGAALPYLIVGLIIILFLSCCTKCCSTCCCPCLKGVCRPLLRCLKGVRRMCCCCFGRRRTMKAPGLDSVIISRDRFEDNPRSYFLNLRSGNSIDEFY